MVATIENIAKGMERAQATSTILANKLLILEEQVGTGSALYKMYDAALKEANISLQVQETLYAGLTAAEQSAADGLTRNAAAIQQETVARERQLGAIRQSIEANDQKALAAQEAGLREATAADMVAARQVQAAQRGLEAFEKAEFRKVEIAYDAAQRQLAAKETEARKEQELFAKTEAAFKRAEQDYLTRQSLQTPGMSDTQVAARFAAIEKEAAGAEKEVGKFLQGMASATLGLPLFAGAALAAGFGVVELGRSLVDMVEKAIQFNLMLIQIANNSGLTREELNQVRETILQLSMVGGASYEQLGAAIQHIENFGFRGADATRILDEAMMSAVSTGGDLAKQADVIAGALHRYKLGAEEATNVTNVLHIAAQQSDATMEQFTGHMDRALGTAALFQVPYTQAAAAVSTLTREFGNAATSQTNFISLLTHLPTPTAKATAEIEKLSQASGVNLRGDFTATALATKHLTGILDDLRAVYAKLGYTQAQITQSAETLEQAQRGGSALAVLLTTGHKDFTNTLKLENDTIEGKTNPTLDNMNRYTESAAGKQAHLTAEWNAGSLAVGQLGAAVAAAFFQGNVDDMRKWGEFLGLMPPQFEALGEAARRMGKENDEAFKLSKDGVDTFGKALEELDGKSAATFSDLQATMENYAKVAETFMDAAGRAAWKHQKDIDQVRAQLEHSLVELENRFNEYAVVATNASGRALINVAANMVALRREIQATALALATLNAMAAGQSAISAAESAKFGMGMTISSVRQANAADKAGDSAARKADAAADASRQADNTLNLARAKEAVADAQNKMNEAEKIWNDLLDAEDAKLKKVQADEDRELGEIKVAWDSAKAAAAGFAQQSAKEVGQLDEKLYQLTQTLKQLEKAAAQSLKPFQAELERTQRILGYIQQDTHDMNTEFDRRAHDLNQQMQPLNDELEQEQANLQAIADKYDKQLIPLNAQLNALHDADARRQHVQQLHDEQIALDNIAARLATATGAEREQLLAQQAKLKAEHDSHAKEFSLEERIAQLNAAKEAEMQGAQAQIKATQDRIHAIEQEQKLLDRQRAEFDYQQRLKEEAAQADVNRAQQALTNQQALSDALTKPYKDEMAAVQEARTVKTHDDQLEQDRLNNIATGYEQYYNRVKGPYENAKDAIGKAKDALTELAKEDKAYWKGIYDDTKNRETALKESYGIIEKIDTAHDKGAKLTEAQATALKEAHDTVAKIVPLLPKLATEYSHVSTDFTTVHGHIRDLVGDLWSTDNNKPDSIPAKYKSGLQNLGTNVIKKELDWQKTEIWGNSFAGLGTEISNGLAKSAKASEGGVKAAGSQVAGYFADGLAAGLNAITGQLSVSFALGGSGEGNSTDSPISWSHRAGGGDVYGNTPYIVGEHGPELFVPGGKGYIYPNGSFGRGGGGGDTYVTVQVGANVKLSSNPADYRNAARAIGMAIHEDKVSRGLA